MNRMTTSKSLLASFPFLYSTATQCNIIWPGLMVGGTLLGSQLGLPFLIIPSIAIEALLYYLFLKNISFLKGLLLSVVGNIASTLVGTIIMMFFSIPWWTLINLLFNAEPFGILNAIATAVFMYLGSCLVEFFAIKVIFQYPSKKLWPPILIGNLATYALTIIYLVIVHKQWL